MMEIRKAGYMDFLNTVCSGVAIDAAKNHTGVVLWDGKAVSTHGFSLSSQSKDDMHAEYRMRLEFKERLKGMVGGMHFGICVIEDIYCGENFDTVRKLAALNTVIDELLFEGTCTADTFYRWPESVWMKHLRRCRPSVGGRKLSSKYEAQEILMSLGFPVEDGNYYEDRCDAAGMLLAACAYRMFGSEKSQVARPRISDVKMSYVRNFYARPGIRDARNREDPYIQVELAGRNLEKEILTEVARHPDSVLMSVLPARKLGLFGVAHKFEFFNGDEDGLLFFHRK